MNTANLQLEGLLMAFAAGNQALVAKGLLTTAELDRALAISEQTALGDDGVNEDMSPANRDAVAFPARLLRLLTTWQVTARYRDSRNWRGWWARRRGVTTTRNREAGRARFGPLPA